MHNDVIFKMLSVMLAALGADQLGKLGILEKGPICSCLRKHPLHGQISLKWSSSPQKTIRTVKYV